MSNMNENGQELTIRDLAIAYMCGDHLAYKKLVNSTHLPLKTQQYLFRKNSDMRFTANCSKFCQNQISILSHNLSEHESTLQETMENYERLNKEVDETRKILTEAKLALLATQKAEKDAYTNYKAKLYLYELLKKDVSKERSIVNDYKNVIHLAQKSLQESQHYILVHQTTTISSLSRKVGYGVLICTTYDATTLNFKKHVDKTIAAQEDYTDLIPDNARDFFESDEQFQSAVEYINLVLQFLFDDKNYELLYNSDGIKYILDSIM